MSWQIGGFASVGLSVGGKGLKSMKATGQHCSVSGYWWQSLCNCMVAMGSRVSAVADSPAMAEQYPGGPSQMLGTMGLWPPLPAAAGSRVTPQRTIR